MSLRGLIRGIIGVYCFGSRVRVVLVYFALDEEVRKEMLCVMPNYDYLCEECGHRFEVFQRMSDDKLKDCPLEGCDAQVRRLLGTGAGVIFKGSGFYETDYRSKSYSEGAKNDSGGKPKEKSDSKPSGN